MKCATVPTPGIVQSLMELQDLTSKNVRSRRDPNDHLALGFMVRRAPHPRDTKSAWGLGVFAAFWYLDSACQIFPGTLKASSERDQHSEGTTRNQEKEEDIYTERQFRVVVTNTGFTLKQA